jgi:gas vesicle protein
MLKIYALIPIFAILAGCEDMSQNQLVGTTGGAAIGAIVTPHNPLQGALIGGAVGLVAGTYLGRDSSGRCVYQRQDGSRYLSTCP